MGFILVRDGVDGNEMEMGERWFSLERKAFPYEFWN